MEISPRAKMEEMSKKGGGGGSKKEEMNGLAPTPAVYIPGNYHPKCPASGPEYPDNPEFSGPGPETPAPPQTK